VVPEGTAIKMVSRDTFSKYKEALSGLTEDNLAQVTARLVQLGLGSGEVSQGGPTVRWGGPAPGGSSGPGGGQQGGGSTPAPGGGGMPSGGAVYQPPTFSYETSHIPSGAAPTASGT
jgi:hypothetical protein